MMKPLIFMTVVMAALIGPSVALNPGELRISSCPEDAFADGLLFDQYTYDAGYRVWEMETTSNGLSFSLSETGMFQYIGEPLTEVTKGGFVYYIYRVDEFGEPISGTYEGHSAVVFVDPCAAEVPTCEYRFSDWDDNIQIGTPVVGETVPVSWSAPGGNGDWSVRIYEDGILNRGKWKGNYPIEVVASELDENWEPTGFQIIDGMCEA